MLRGVVGASSPPMQRLFSEGAVGGCSSEPAVPRVLLESLE